MIRILRCNTFIGLAGALGILVATASSAQIIVSDPQIDVATRGDWRGTYGECFILLPQAQQRLVEEPVGPGPFRANPGQYGSTCFGGPLFDANKIDWRVFMRPEEDSAFAWSYLEPDDPPNQNTIREGTSQWNACLDEFRNGTFDNDRFSNDPMSLELTVQSGGDARVAYYLLNGATECRELGYSLSIDGAVAKTGTISDFADGKYVVFDIANLPESSAGTNILFQTFDAPGSPSCGITNEVSGLNAVISGALINGTNVCATVEPLACRFTGGGVDTDGNWNHVLEDGETIRNGAGNLPEGIDRYQFGGQAGANTGQQPQPKGEWTHHQQRGPSGAFTFHGGTASAPAGSEVVEIRCSDPGACLQARDAPAKQLDFDGIGTFKSIGNGSRAPIFEVANANAEPEPHGNQSFGGTFHWFEVNIDDLGEPGGFNSGAPMTELCPDIGFGEKGATELANCECPDFYRITIYNGVSAADVVFDASGDIDLTSLDRTTVIYQAFGYIDGGNLQLHPPTGFDQ